MASPDDHRLALQLAQGAGALLLDVRAGAEGTDVGAEGDRRSHEWLCARLASERPGDDVLSEEGRHEERATTRRGARRVWVIDPLDGTREFSEGRTDFAVHVALVESGDLTAGAVALPGEGLAFGTAAPPSLAPLPHRRLRLLVSRTRPPAEAAVVAQALGAEVIPMGSAGAKTMAIVRGEADVYLHAGGQYEWDSAAPVAVARAAGLHASRLDGSRLAYDQPDPWLPDLLVCRPELTEQILAALHRSSP
jgi:3'(2'), 5'-bisphosphate nucleotidase